MASLRVPLPFWGSTRGCLRGSSVASASHSDDLTMEPSRELCKLVLGPQELQFGVRLPCKAGPPSSTLRSSIDCLVPGNSRWRFLAFHVPVKTETIPVPYDTADTCQCQGKWKQTNMKILSACYLQASITCDYLWLQSSTRSVIASPLLSWSPLAMQCCSSPNVTLVSHL